MLLRTERRATMPSRLRSSGRRPRPAAIAARGLPRARLPAFDADLARLGPVDAGDEAQEFRAPRADEARDAEHLALAELEARLPHGRPARQAR